ncbi:hypothetical protein ASD79_06600 [Caulobacter sp. Root655]|uniref:hypothetical protein n=1 Tax=Caulobacter sp. Root655 TaxID=1736578 RepID=UPI0006FD1FA5|nr:hypothetical protein [Caulobacter sp. Root655]KRA61773.1 hypothetical protein ASD79_06600 [Caulobacter sp. Root655]
MRVRGPSDRPPFSISHSELFEEAVFVLQRQFPFIDDAVQNAEWLLRRAPFNNERCPAFEGRDLFIALAPKTPRSPALRLLYEVGGQKVFLWHLSVREA